MTGIPSGWVAKPITAFDTLIGPFYFPAEGGTEACGFLADERHANRRGVVHGGMITPAFDVALGMRAWEAAGECLCATIQLNVHFSGALRIGDFAIVRAEVVRSTRSLVFMRGLMTAGEQTVASGDGVWKILRPEAQG